MNTFKNLNGQKFGELLVIERATNDKQGRARWKCSCSCGNECIVQSSDLLMSKVYSCGHTKIKNLINKKFGELVVIKKAPHKDGRACWLCLCSCGKETIVRSSNLLTGVVRSCGHLHYASASEKSFLDKLEPLINEKIIRQFCILTERGRRFYDGLIKSSDTLIEVDGECWHTTPTATENDEFKNIVAQKHGYKLIRYPCNNLQSVDQVLKSINILVLNKTAR